MHPNDCICGREHFATRAIARRRANNYRGRHGGRGRFSTQACPFQPGYWTFGTAGTSPRGAVGAA